MPGFCLHVNHSEMTVFQLASQRVYYINVLGYFVARHFHPCGFFCFFYMYEKSHTVFSLQLPGVKTKLFSEDYEIHEVST